MRLPYLVQVHCSSVWRGNSCWFHISLDNIRPYSDQCTFQLLFRLDALDAACTCTQQLAPPRLDWRTLLEILRMTLWIDAIPVWSWRAWYVPRMEEETPSKIRLNNPILLDNAMLMPWHKHRTILSKGWPQILNSVNALIILWRLLLHWQFSPYRNAIFRFALVTLMVSCDSRAEYPWLMRLRDPPLSKMHYSRSPWRICLMQKSVWLHNLRPRYLSLCCLILSDWSSVSLVLREDL